MERRKKKQISQILSEAESILDESKKRETFNFKFCDSRKKNSSIETGKLNSETEDYEVYYKTNALGYAIGLYL